MLSLLLFLWVAGCAGRAPMPVPQPLPETPPARIWSAAQLADLRAVAQAAPGHGFALESEAIAQIDRLEPLSLRDAEMARRLDATADAVFERLALSLAIGAFDPAEATPNGGSRGRCRRMWRPYVRAWLKALLSRRRLKVCFQSRRNMQPLRLS